MPGKLLHDPGMYVGHGERIRAADFARAATAPAILLGVVPQPVRERLPLDLGDEG